MKSEHKKTVSVNFEKRISAKTVSTMDAPPVEFNGHSNENVKSWIQKFECYCNLHGLTGTPRELFLFRFLLQKSASCWFNRQKPEVSGNIQRAKEELVKEYQIKDYLDLDLPPQGLSENTEQYLYRAEELFSHGMSEKEVMRTALQGLKRSMIMHVRMQRPSTWSEFKSACRLVENSFSSEPMTPKPMSTFLTQNNKYDATIELCNKVSKICEAVTKRLEVNDSQHSHHNYKNFRQCGYQYKRPQIQRQPIQRQPIQKHPIQRQPIQRQPIQRHPIQQQPMNGYHDRYQQSWFQQNQFRPQCQDKTDSDITMDPSQELKSNNNEVEHIQIFSASEDVLEERSFEEQSLEEQSFKNQPDNQQHENQNRELDVKCIYQICFDNDHDSECDADIDSECDTNTEDDADIDSDGDHECDADINTECDSINDPEYDSEISETEIIETQQEKFQDEPKSSLSENCNMIMTTSKLEHCQNQQNIEVKLSNHVKIKKTKDACVKASDSVITEPDKHNNKVLLKLPDLIHSPAPHIEAKTTKIDCNIGSLLWNVRKPNRGKTCIENVQINFIGLIGFWTLICQLCFGCIYMAILQVISSAVKASESPRMIITKYAVEGNFQLDKYKKISAYSKSKIMLNVWPEPPDNISTKVFARHNKFCFDVIQSIFKTLEWIRIQTMYTKFFI